MDLTQQINKIKQKHRISRLKTEASENLTIRGEFKHFMTSTQKSVSLCPKIDPPVQLSALDSLVKKQREKLKLNPLSRENKFNKKLQNFSSLKTFTDISKFLQDLNIVNNQTAYNESQILRQKLDTLCRVQQFADFRTKHQPDQFKPSHGYTMKMKSIQAKMNCITSPEDLFHSQSLQQLRGVNKIGLVHYKEKKDENFSTLDLECENEDDFYDHIMVQLENGSVPKKVIAETQEHQDAIEELFSINQMQEKEKQRLESSIQTLEKSVGNKLVIFQMNKNVQVNSKKYYETFQKKSKKIIHLLQLRQIQELQDRQEELDNIPMYTKKKTSPKKLFQLYKNKTYGNGNTQNLKNQKIALRHKEKELHNKNMDKIMNPDAVIDISDDSIQNYVYSASAIREQPIHSPLISGLKKFRNAFKKIAYQRTKNSADKLRLLIKMASVEVKQNQNDNNYFNDLTDILLKKNELQMNKYEDRMIDSIRGVETQAMIQAMMTKKVLRMSP